MHDLYHVSPKIRHVLYEINRSPLTNTMDSYLDWCCDLRRYSHGASASVPTWAGRSEVDRGRASALPESDLRGRSERLVAQFRTEVIQFFFSYDSCAPLVVLL